MGPDCKEELDELKIFFHAVMSSMGRLKEIYTKKEEFDLLQLSIHSSKLNFNLCQIT